MVVPSEQRGKFFAILRTFVCGLSVIFIVFITLFLKSENNSPVPLWKFDMLVLFFGILFFARLIPLSRLKISFGNFRKDREFASFKDILIPLKDRNYRFFVIVSALIWFFLGLYFPFIIPFLKQDLLVPDYICTFIPFFHYVGNVLSLYIWGRICDKYGSKIVFVFGLIFISISPLILIFVPSYISLRSMFFFGSALAYFLSGIGGAGVTLGWSVGMLGLAPEDRKTVYTSFATVATLAVGFSFGSFLGGSIIKIISKTQFLGDISPYRFVFSVSAAVLFLMIFVASRMKKLGEQPVRVILYSISTNMINRIFFWTEKEENSKLR
jgi:MFS family permease